MLEPSPTRPARLDAALVRPPVTASREEEPGPRVCLAAPGFLTKTGRLPPAPPASLTSAAFGLALVAAARAQTGEFVIYNDKYRRIAYPMSDVAPLYGVCTDVVIRAYRALGIDLQQMVHESGFSGTGTSIGHLRTETLRRYFARFGHELPPSTIGEDYRPGDIVTYNRPQNRHSKSHIVIVSDIVAPSGRHMIIDNRGGGPQAEDALFVDEITPGITSLWQPPAKPP